MKRVIYVFALLIICETCFSQNKLQDGVYLVDRSAANSIAPGKTNKAIVKFNPFFFEGDPDTYKPLVVFTDDFVPFKLAAAPVIQHQNGNEGQVLVHLTDSAAQKLGEFTAKNRMSEVVVVIDNQAIAVYKVFEPVSSALIKITRCTGSACSLISHQLKNSLKI